MVTPRAAVDDVEVQRRRVVGEREQRVGLAVRWRGVEKIGEGHDRKHSAQAVGTRRHRRRLEVPGDLEQAGRILRVQLDPLTVVIDERELRHRRNLPGRRAETTGSVAAMRAVVFPGDGTVEVADRPTPTPGAGEVLVRVHGAGLNRADLVQQAGFYPAPPGSPPDIPGMEFSGEVAALGTGVTAHSVGDRVFGIVGGGAQAEALVVHETNCARVPDHLDLLAAGGIPEVFITAHDAMRTRAGLQPGEHVLVHAVGSGVGTAVVQLAKALGCTVTGTARTETKLDQARALGLDHGVLATSPLDPTALAQTIVDRGGEANVTIELVGGDYVHVDLAAAAYQGRIVIVGTLAGGQVELPLFTLMIKRLALHGTTLRGRSIEQKGAAVQAFVDEVGPLLADGRVQPVVDQILPLEEAAAAYALLASDATFGKVILRAVSARTTTGSCRS